MSKAETDWLVIIQVSGGGGSWFRDKNRDKAIKECRRIFLADWKSLFKFKKGEKLTAQVWDIAGHDDVNWGYFGIFDSNTKERIPDDKGALVELTI